jgi:hypothetical protein
MIQPYIQSAEYKVVLLGGNASHLVVWPGGGASFGTVEDIKTFAENALKLLRDRCSYMLDYKSLWRVDVMMDHTGSFIVNEFEHLDALYASRNELDNVKVLEFLETYWFQTVKDLIS